MQTVHKKTVLVVEDELDMRLFIKALLETSGYTPVMAKNGRDGLGKAKTAKPDLILLDMMMPEEGGALMYHHLKTDPALKKIPVIILSAVDRSTFGHYLKMLNTQMKDAIPFPEAYMEKPPEPRNLLRMVQKFV